ncbi:MAG TPA: hypothetical protein VK422_15035 [Pyrinomonadaceae bacterium]|nr:hypothetical protein [Pyrinomonadaceae bacterium]
MQNHIKTRAGLSPYLIREKWALVADVNGVLTREGILESSADVTVKSWLVAVPTTAARSEVLFDGGRRRDRFVRADGMLEVSATADWPLEVSLQAAGGGALGHNARGGVPLHLVYEVGGLRLKAGEPARWRITLKAEEVESR